MLTCKSFQNSSEEVADTGQLTRKIKISGPELIFDYLLHLANLIFGITVFTLLIHFDQEYASTIEKVKAASGFSMSTMIYFVCPAALSRVPSSNSCITPGQSHGRRWDSQRSGPPSSSFLSPRAKSSRLQNLIFQNLIFQDLMFKTSLLRSKISIGPKHVLECFHISS